MRHQLRFFLSFLAAIFALAAPTVAEPTPAVSARRDIRVLAPAGIAAKWPLTIVTLDMDGKTSYTIFRRDETHGELHGVRTQATREKPTDPKFRDVAEGQQGRDPVRLDKEVYIPALKRTVRYYMLFEGGGADNDTYATEPVKWPDGHGGTLWLVVEAEYGGKGTLSPANLLASVDWLKPGVVARWEKEHSKRSY